MDLKGTEWEGVKWSSLVQVRDQSWALVNMAMSRCVQLEASYFMTNRPINSVYWRILLQGVARNTNPIKVCNKKKFAIYRYYSVSLSTSQSFRQTVVSYSVSQSVYLVTKMSFLKLIIQCLIEGR